MLGSLGNTGKEFGKKVITDLGVLLARYNLPGIVSNLSSNTNSNVMDKQWRKIIGKGAVRVGKWFTSLIANEDMNNIIKIIKSLEDLNILIDGITETVKHEMKKQKLVPLC